MIVIKIFILPETPEMFRVRIATHDVDQLPNHLPVHLYALLPAFLETVLKARVIIIEVKFQVSRFLTILFTKLPNIMVNLAMRTKCVYPSSPHIGGDTIKLTIQ